MPLIDSRFKTVAADVGGSINSESDKGHLYILTLVDFATRYPEAKALKHINTEAMEEALAGLYSRLEIPEEFLSDMWSQFVSDCMQKVARLLSI